MSKTFGISTARSSDGTWRWELHVPKGSEEDYMKGFAQTEAEAETSAKQAQMRYGQELSR
jgi:hypothetical protein